MTNALNEKQQYVKEVRSQLKYGDRRMIASIVKCSPELVKKVLTGERDHKKGKGALVIQTAVRIIKTREILDYLDF